MSGQASHLLNVLFHPILAGKSQFEFGKLLRKCWKALLLGKTLELPWKVPKLMRESAKIGKSSERSSIVGPSRGKMLSVSQIGREKPPELGKMIELRKSRNVAPKKA